jgi:hypothetical protein
MRAAALALLVALGPAAPAAWPAAAPTTPRTPAEHRRAEEQTYLTYPEWFLVFSPREFADHVRREPPSGFPLPTHLLQFWQGYAAVHAATRDAYPVNAEYHVMVMVIGVSTTVEYGVRHAYETLVGRLTELVDGTQSDEDRIAARVADEYASFLDGRAWFEFDFAKPLREVWSAPLWGRDPLRKWERRYALTTEYAAKALYGALILRATRSSFEVPKLVTLAVVEGLSPEASERVPGLEVVERFPDGAALVSLPRYQRFTDGALALAEEGASFLEIAGNSGPILVSALVAPDWRVSEGQRELLRQPLLTGVPRERVLLELRVPTLAADLRRLSREALLVEHVFDY